MEAFRCHRSPADAIDARHRFTRRKPQPAVCDFKPQTREAGELDLAKLAAAAALEALHAERRGRRLILPSAGTSIKSPALRALAQQARRDLARMTTNQLADHQPAR